MSEIDELDGMLNAAQEAAGVEDHEALMAWIRERAAEDHKPLISRISEAVHGHPDADFLGFDAPPLEAAVRVVVGEMQAYRRLCQAYAAVATAGRT
jgi:hypothetical protein